MNEGDESQACILSTTPPREEAPFSQLPTPLYGGSGAGGEGVLIFFGGVRGASGEDVEHATLNLKFPHKFSAANTKLSIATT